MKGIQLLALFLLVMLPAQVQSQIRFTTPDGEAIVAKRIIRHWVTIGGKSTLLSFGAFATNKHVWLAWSDAKLGNWVPVTGGALYQAPYLNNIVSVTLRSNLANKNDNKLHWYVLQNNGVVVKGYTVLTSSNGAVNSASTTNYSSEIQNAPGETFTKIMGGNLYVYSSQRVWSSTDDAASWNEDTVGLLGASPRMMSFDTLNTPWLMTNRGLYYKTGNGLWMRDSAFPLTGGTVLFIDRLNRMFAYGTRLMVSLNGGTTFVLDTIGLNNLTVRYIEDDPFNNLFVLGSSNAGITVSDRIYRSWAGSQPFARIDQALAGINLETTITGLFNEIGGDSLLVVTTRYGAFTSTDRGDVWSPATTGIASEQTYGLVRTGDGGYICTTNLGAFYKGPLDAVWMQQYPGSGYLGGQPVYRDTANRLYTRGANINASANSPRLVVKSVDNGTVWVSDTLHMYSIGTTRFYVDEYGVQHAGRVGAGGPGGGSMVYFKPQALPWQLDSSGLTFGTGVSPSSMGSNQIGSLFVAMSNGNLFKRAITGGKWSLDTTGLSKSIPSSFNGTKTGSSVISTPQGAFYQNSGPWKPIPPPSAIPNSRPSSVTVDDSDNVWISYQHNDSLLGTMGDGVWHTRNFGLTWQRALGSIDTVTFKQLVDIGDTVYGISVNDGIYILTLNPNIERLAMLDLNTRSIDFGNVLLTKSKDSMLTITNSGAEDLHITSISSNSPAFIPQATKLDVVPGGSGQLTIRFTPLDTNPSSGSIILSSNAKSISDTIRVMGQGLTSIPKSARLQFSVRTIDFGVVPVGIRKDTTLTLSDTGTAAVQVTNIVSTNPVFSSGTTNLLLEPMGSAPITLSFLPTSSGSYSGRIRFVSNATNSTDSINVLGVGTNISSVSGKEFAPGYRIYEAQPNPATQKSIIEYEIPKAGSVVIELVSSTGVVLHTYDYSSLQPGRHNLTLDCSALSAGIYFVRVVAGANVGTGRLLIVK